MTMAAKKGSRAASVVEDTGGANNVDVASLPEFEIMDVSGLPRSASRTSKYASIESQLNALLPKLEPGKAFLCRTIDGVKPKQFGLMVSRRVHEAAKRMNIEGCYCRRVDGGIAVVRAKA